MTDLLLKGCGTALVTPFTSDGDVDYEAYAALIDRQVAAGVDFLCPLVTTGETPTLSASEKVEMMKVAKAHCGGLPLLVGCGSNAFEPTLENMELLDGFEPDAWLVVVPFYNKPTQEGQYEYFRAVAAATSRPIVIYNVPGRTGANMSADTCIRLALECENIIGVKEASGTSWLPAHTEWCRWRPTSLRPRFRRWSTPSRRRTTGRRASCITACPRSSGPASPSPIPFPRKPHSRSWGSCPQPSACRFRPPRRQQWN